MNLYLPHDSTHPQVIACCCGDSPLDIPESFQLEYKSFVKRAPVQVRRKSTEKRKVQSGGHCNCHFTLPTRSFGSLVEKGSQRPRHKETRGENTWVFVNLFSDSWLISKLVDLSLKSRLRAQAYAFVLIKVNGSYPQVIVDRTATSVIDTWVYMS